MSRRRATYRAHHIGRVRIQAAEILTRGLGFTVQPEDIVLPTGAWRTDWRLDVYRWELFTKNERGLPLIAGCWWTLTEFCKLSKTDGFHIHDDEIYPGKEPIKRCRPASKN